ncbi:MAG: hypothetical protein E6X17_05870 [Sporomusaceae bacterium]|nr:hypothetical protein [Sporomusaceae bacterium]
MRWLMTHSLLSSWLYQFDAYEDYAEKAKADFLAVLRREPREASEAMQRGNEFEQLVYDVCDCKADSSHQWYDAAAYIADSVRGGQRQLVAMKTVTIDGMDLLLYGRIDCLKAGTVYDIKYTGSYAVGKYIASTQHPMYLELIPEASRFIYAVSNGRNAYLETYRRDEVKPIQPLIQDFLTYLRGNGLLEVYREMWRSR